MSSSRQKEKGVDSVSSTKSVYASLASSLMTNVIEPFTYPIGTVTKRIQVSSREVHSWPSFKENVLFNHPLRSTSPSVSNPQQMIKKVGIKEVGNLYKGFSTNILQKTGSKPVKLAGQKELQKVVERSLGLDKAENKDATLNTLTNMATGAAAGAGEVVGFQWLDTANTKQQLGDPRSLPKMIAQEKFKLYNGATAALARNIPGNIYLFGAYSIAMAAQGNPEKPNFTQSLVASSVAAVATAIGTNPQDMVKVRQQGGLVSAQFIPAMKQTLQQEGIHVLSKGVGPKVIKSELQIALPLLIFNYFAPKALDYIANKNKERNQDSPMTPHRLPL